MLLELATKPLRMERAGSKIGTPQADNEIESFLLDLANNALLPSSVLSVNVFSLPMDEHAYQWATTGIARADFKNIFQERLLDVVRYGKENDLAVGRDVGIVLPEKCDYILHIKRQVVSTENRSKPKRSRGPRKSSVLSERWILCEEIRATLLTTSSFPVDDSQRNGSWCKIERLHDARVGSASQRSTNELPKMSIEPLSKDCQPVLLERLKERAQEYPKVFAPLLCFGDVALLLPASFEIANKDINERRLAAGLTVVFSRTPQESDFDELHRIAVLVGQRMALLSVVVEQARTKGEWNALRFSHHELKNAFTSINWDLDDQDFRSHIRSFVDVEEVVLIGAESLLLHSPLQGSSRIRWSHDLCSKLCSLARVDIKSVDDTNASEGLVSHAGVLLLLECMRNVHRHSRNQKGSLRIEKDLDDLLTFTIKSPAVRVDADRICLRIIGRSENGPPTAVKIVQTMALHSDSAMPKIRYRIPEAWIPAESPSSLSEYVFGDAKLIDEIIIEVQNVR